MIIFSVIELVNSQLFYSIYNANPPHLLSPLYGMGIWYVWLIFTIAFGY